MNSIREYPPTAEEIEEFIELTAERFEIGDVVCPSVFGRPTTILLIVDILPGQIYKCMSERSWNYYHLEENFDANVFIINDQDIIDRLKKRYQTKILIDIIEK